ncbi:ABC transporter ATP-binding protein [Pectinatus haikarae]|uniref:Taurine transport system ATP-binding protein n=1 Tax=Pectinatus haikarae TaxID=349096 RepID=A0ABT9Y3N8_9FIRM|nr:ABC transporter ATP-binding protein [Pectinatus haikarae]MDQ0202444.1 taurine transport system ATP-binding protein [Pectinatus haikarae]
MISVRQQENLENIIRLSNVSLAYSADSANVLENIDLSLNKKEFVCVLGPSGCGKSTLLKIIAGFIFPSQGTAQFGTKAIAGPDWQRGVVFQQPPLYPWLNVAENIRFGLKMRHFSKKQSEDLITDYLEKVGLLAFRNHKPYELSGGMKQRVAIARTLINNPLVLLMDEPFGALDALTREQMQAMLRKIWLELNNTILFITHDVDEALSLGTRVLVMAKGPGRIIREYKTSFTYSAAQENTESIYHCDDFLHMRGEILHLIRSAV